MCLNWLMIKQKGSPQGCLFVLLRHTVEAVRTWYELQDAIFYIPKLN